MKNCLTPKNPKTCDPILVTLLKIRLHYSHSRRENATRSSGKSPIASYKEVPPPPVWDNWDTPILKGRECKSALRWGYGYRKIPKISPGACIFQRPFLRGLYTEGYLRFKINWASLIVGSKCTVLALFYFVFEGNFPSTSPRRAYSWGGEWGGCDLAEGFLRHRFGGLIFGGAYFWNFTVLIKFFWAFKSHWIVLFKSIKNGKILKFKIYIWMTSAVITSYFDILMSANLIWLIFCTFRPSLVRKE